MTPDPTVTTCLWFNNSAEAAAQLYVSLLPNSAITKIHHQLAADGSKGGAFLVEFHLMGQRYTAMNGGPHYTLTPATSIQVFVETQAEVDRLWSTLLAGGGEESRCGWLTDAYGLSWQIIPNALPRYLANGGGVAERVMGAMMAMVKLDIAAMDRAAADQPPD